MEPLYICVEEEKKIIPSTFSMTDWTIGDVYRLKVVHVNTPTDFWIVQNPEYLQEFQNNLCDFYSTYERTHRLIPPCTLSRYWVVYVNGWYYRAILITDPLLADSLMVLEVFLLDFGRFEFVKPTDFFWFRDELHNVPQFSVRATLSGSTSYESPISPVVAADFKEMMEQKIILVKLTGVDVECSVIHLDLINCIIESECKSLN